MKYRRLRDGEWVKPIMSGFRLACCHCGLVHRVDFRIVKGRIFFRAHRAKRSTALMRRHRRIGAVKR